LFMAANTNALRLGISAVAALALARALLRRSRYMDLHGKIVFITGGSRGLGLVLAREFANRGARVAVCARDSQELDRVRSEFQLMGSDFLAVSCDVRVQGDVQTAVRIVQEQLGPIDVLVNNAGTIITGPMENQSIEAFEDAMATNFWGAVYATLAVISQMKRRHTGRIVNITSIGGKVAFPHLLPYTASKFAFVGFSEGLRAELLKDNVFVTTVCPSLMRTGSPRNANFTGQSEKEYTWFILSDSAPGASISAKRAATKIVRASMYGVSEVHVGMPAKLATVVQGIAPGLTADVFGYLNMLLMPAPADGQSEPRKGYESETSLTGTYLTKLTRVAEAANNQL
jgi:NAD(P)-dependent dehydrogenase (short-subunit alcohol dehydrogenase family)